jgi:hypothetical protein
MQLLDDIQITQISNGATAGTTPVTSSIINMSGYDGVLFIASMGTVTNGSVLTLQCNQNTANSTSGMAEITGAITAAVTASSSSNTLMVLDVYRPLEQYLEAVWTPTTDNAALNCIIAIQYKASKKPTVQGSTVVAALATIGQ